MVLIGWIWAVSGVGRIIMPFTASLAWRVGAEFVLHPLIHTSGLSESSTKCGSGLLRGKVWSM
jgi:hypothetical protein